MENNKEKNQETNTTSLLDLSKLRIGQNYQDLVAVKKRQVTIQKTKPDDQWFFRAHPDAGYWFNTALFKYKEEKEFFVVAPELWSHIETGLKPMCLVTCITRSGNLFLWPIQLPGQDGKQHDAHRSSFVAAEIAKEKWIRIQYNHQTGSYDVFEAAGQLSEPEWPEMSFSEILNTAFKNNYIDSLEHPAVKSIKGA